MTTLTTVAAAFKKALVISIFGVLAIIFLWNIFSLIKSFIKPKIVEVGPQVNTVFGKLPAVKFPNQAIPSDIRFSIETISGSLPEASPTAKVYFFPKKQRGLLTNISTEKIARDLGFGSSGNQRDGLYLYNEGLKSLNIDPVTKDFSYNYNYQVDGSVFEGEGNLDESSVMSIARKFLTDIAPLPDSVDRGEVKVTLLTFNGHTFIPLGENEDKGLATSARVDFLREAVDERVVVGSKYNEGTIYAIVAKTKDESKQVIKVEWKYQEPGSENIGVYPLRSSAEAWNEFLSGGGYIASGGKSTFTKRVVIRDAALGYYDSSEAETYLMPIYIFTGDGGFVAYANAISGDWLNPN